MKLLWVQFAEILVKIDEIQQVLVEHGGGRERHENLIFSAVRADLRNLDEAPSLVLLDIKIEPLALEYQVPRRKVSLSTNEFFCLFLL